jgi:hypothetical protein
MRRETWGDLEGRVVQGALRGYRARQHVRLKRDRADAQEHAASLEKRLALAERLQREAEQKERDVRSILDASNARIAQEALKAEILQTRLAPTGLGLPDGNAP